MSLDESFAARHLPLALCAVLVAGAAGAAVPTPSPMAGSPGAADRALAVRDGCPTFSWSEVEGQRGYEIAAYRILDGGIASGAPLLRTRIAGAFLSWTPSLDECLSPGHYAWVVRANTAVGWTEWSEPRLFEVRGSAPGGAPPEGARTARPAESERPGPAARLDGLSPSSVGLPGERLFTPAPPTPRSLVGAAFSPVCNGFMFADVSDSNPYCGWIEQLAQDEIASPCEPGSLFSPRYCPDQPVTRGQIAMLLERAMRGTDAWRPEQGDGAVPNLPPALAGFNPLDTGGDVGTHTAITVGADGLGLISYYDASGNLRVAHCSNVDCTILDTITLRDSGVFGYSSLIIGTDGFGLISYYDAGSGDLKVVHCTNVSCTTADTPAPLDTTDDVGPYPSIAIGADGFGLISYYDAFHGWLKVAHCSNTNCSAATISPLDAPVVGQYTSITIGTDGLGLISYYDALQHDLKVAHCSNTNCTSFTSVPLDAPGDAGQYTSITFGADGLGLISYYVSGDLRVAHCSNVNCTAATITPLDTAGDVGQYTSITIGTDGLGLISYYDNTNHDLKIAHCSNPNCTAATISPLDTGGDVGQYSSITIGADGLGLISYYDNTNHDLKVAHCSNVLCAPYFRRR